MTKLLVVLYGYDASPFATKVKYMLALKRIPYKLVNVSMILPRPELSELLGITYRRIPILAIGNDVYCDTALIASVLEHRFPISEGYGTLFPPRKGGGSVDTGLVKALSLYWVDRTIFPLGAQSLPYSRFDAKFLADRSSWQGGPIDAKALAARQGFRTSALCAHVGLLEEQLSDGRDWAMDTEQPSLVDISAYFVFSWLKAFKTVKDIYDPIAFPKTIAWMGRVSDYLAQAQKQSPSDKITGEEAARLICSSPRIDSESVGFDQAGASRLSLKLGELASVTPTDNGKVPTVGRLVALSREETVVEVRGSAGAVRCHFPRLEYAVEPAGPAVSKL